MTVHGGGGVGGHVQCRGLLACLFSSLSPVSSMYWFLIIHDVTGSSGMTPPPPSFVVCFLLHTLDGWKYEICICMCVSVCVRLYVNVKFMYVCARARVCVCMYVSVRARARVCVCVRAYV